MRRMRIGILLVVQLFLLYTAVPVFAQITPSPALDPQCLQTEIGCISTDVPTFVSQYYQYGLGLVGGLAVIFIIIGGYKVMISRGNPQELNDGKAYIGYAIAGLLLAIFGYLFVEVIARDLLRIPGFG